MEVGAHVSIAGGVDNAVDNELSIGGTCGQIFTHSPQMWQDPGLDTDEITAFREETAEHLAGPWVIHSSYLVNLCTPKDGLRAKSIDAMQKEVDAAADLGIDYVNVHLGAHTGAGVEQGLANAASAIDELKIPDEVTVLVESDAGSGTKLGGEFDHLATIIDSTNPEIEVCLDTAHAFAAGYDLSDPAAVDETIAAFDTVIGLDKLSCIHLNDSKHGCGTNKDEHAHLGEGEIGEAGIRRIVTHPALDEVPLVLETPNEEDRGFEWDLARVREYQNGR